MLNILEERFRVPLKRTNPELDKLEKRRDNLWAQLRSLLDVRGSVIGELRNFDAKICSALDTIEREQEERNINDDSWLLD